MSRIIQKSLDTMKDGLDSLKNIKEDKRAYRAYVRRIRSLPDDYQFVYEKITRYMWSFSGGGNGCDMMALQSDLLEVFEAGVADGRHVSDLTGEDVAAFCDELLRNARTYTEDQRVKLNREIQQKWKNG